MSNNNHCFNSLPVDRPNNKNKNLLSEYNIIKIIGRGNFSIVKLGEHKLTKEKVAIKIMKKSQIINQDDLIRIDREIQMLKSLNHENVIKIYNIFEDLKRFYIIMEYCENGELFNRIVEKNRLTEDESAIFYYQLINGLEYIHKNNIIHRDLKPENLLLSKDDILKIIDFGLSNYSRYDILLDTPCGSPCYASPEMVNGQRYNGFLTDIWSTGIILYAMICGYLPFEDNNDGKLFEKIFYCKIHYPKHIGELPLDLLKKIIVSDPCKRITLEQIKQHPFYLKGKSLFNQKNEMKKNNNKKISVKNITPNINYKILKNILKKGYKFKDDFNDHAKIIDTDLLDNKPCISKNKDNKLSKVYKLNETENGNNKKIDNEEEKNDKGNNLKEDFNNYNTCKKNQSKNKLNYRTPTDTIPKNIKFISKVFNCSNSKNNEIKETETEMKSKKSTEKINKIKKVQKPYIFETSHKKGDNFGKSYAFNEPKTVRNKIRVKKISLTKKNNILMEKHNHTLDLGYEQMYNNDNKINLTYNNKVSKAVEGQKCVSSPKNRDILIYSLTNKYPHNNHRKKDINQTEKKIYDYNSQNGKFFKENNNLNLTIINKNNQKKSGLIHHFNKKLINSKFNKKKSRNDEYIPDKFAIYNLSKDKNYESLIENNNNIDKYNKFNNYFDKVTKILQNKYDDSQWIDKSILHKKKLNNLKIKKKEALNMTESISTEKEKGNFNLNDENKNRFKNNTLEYNDISFINKETEKISVVNFRFSENRKINTKEHTLNTQRKKNSLEDGKNNNDYSKYQQNINNRFETNKKVPKKKNKANVIDIKNIKNNMKFYKNVNYIIYNNSIENNKSRKINNDKNNNSIHKNDKNDKLFETIKFKNSYQTYDLNNSKNENDIYFEQIRNKEENLNFKNVSTNKNYIKKIDKMNNKTLNIMKNNNIVKRTCDILNNDPLERLNLTSRNQRLLKEKFDNVNNDSYLSTEKSYFLFDKINNINELQRSNCETLNYNSITNPGNNVYTFPYTNYIDNIYPKENYTLLNPFETHRIINSSIGKQYSNILNE